MWMEFEDESLPQQPWEERLRTLVDSMDGSAREEVARLVADRAERYRLDDYQWQQLAMTPTAHQCRRSDRYLLLLQCAGGPRVHGESLEAFEFLTWLELIPADDFWTIRGQEELSDWIEQVRSGYRCGEITESMVTAAESRVCSCLSSRFRATDVESREWCEAFVCVAGGV